MITRSPNTIISTSHLPCVVVVGKGNLTVEDFDVQAKLYDGLLADGVAYGVFADYRQTLGMLNVDAGKYWREWSIANMDAIQVLTQRSATLINGAIQRTVVNTFLKISRSPFEHKMFADPFEAVQWQLQGLTSPSLKAGQIVQTMHNITAEFD